MAPYTTFLVGGNVEALYECHQLDELQHVIIYLNEEAIPYIVVGRGSNLLVKDGGLEGVALLLGGSLGRIHQEAGNDQFVVSGAGQSLSNLLNFCRSEHMGGLEFLAGIPGTVGGALAMNAGAFGQEIESKVRELQLVSAKGELIVRDRSKLEFSYRALALESGWVIVRAQLRVFRESSEVIAGRIADYLKKRKATQPIQYPSAGSVFKNPPSDYAGRLIEKAGLKGRRVGGAMISRDHANYIVNTGNAKAADILALLELAREEVRTTTGVLLEPEIRVVGR